MAAKTDHPTRRWPPGTGLRYLEWTTDPDPSDTTYQVDYAILTRDADGTVRVRHDQHIEGLFPQETWLRSWMSASGLVDDPEGRVTVGTRPPLGRPPPDEVRTARYPFRRPRDRPHRNADADPDRQPDGQRIGRGADGVPIPAPRAMPRPMKLPRRCSGARFTPGSP